MYLPIQVMQEMQVLSLDWEDPLEEEMATHSTILAWDIPWAEGPGGLQSMDYKQSDMIERLTLSLFKICSKKECNMNKNYFITLN